METIYSPYDTTETFLSNLSSNLMCLMMTIIFSHLYLIQTFQPHVGSVLIFLIDYKGFYHKKSFISVRAYERNKFCISQVLANLSNREQYLKDDVMHEIKEN